MRLSASTLARAAKAQAEPLHRCPDPDCNAPLDIPGGCTFSVKDRVTVVRLTVWCQSCGGRYVAVYRRSPNGDSVKVTVEKVT